MKIGNFYGAVDFYRKEKIAYAQFLVPHRVLSTCRLNGGLREDLEYLYNHQSCEPANHTGTDLCHVAVKHPARYQERITSKAGIPYEKSASLGTAANMHNAAIAREQFLDLEVVAVTTAGVGGNGGRAGDPASYYQSEDGAKPISALPPQAGTINSLLFVSEELSPGALVVASTVMAEAKASVLQELSTPSRYSEGIATGTGTDQIGIASRIGTRIRHTDANKHSKLGELIGTVLRRSLFEALNLQAGMTPDSRRSSIVALQRLGETQERFIAGVKSGLSESDAGLFERNFLAANHDPVTVSCIQALVHLRDQFVWGVLPLSCLREIMVPHLVRIASVVSGKELVSEIVLEAIGEQAIGIERNVFLELIHCCFSIGFSEKWRGRFEDPQPVDMQPQPQ
ncbi:adenosylcobinamide amidohydrolase [Pelagicoccus sp. SDUM812003]|uniref:adenosylcobinamide amidohydrolase n=1 Tax=Pelagicoccus sp. SDUM812003 TaxID=3041267 RepID=UPI00280E2C16|nr:adenosylcobinamide amidohydrolase [Pelagicoccus sp. SDUM812003]MDQ8203136.1 adenosylcobinamide amidohydrolase [Pelagicoccus sp. SDUM812003]